MSITVTSVNEKGELVISNDNEKPEASKEVKSASAAKVEDETEENSEALENESDEVEGSDEAEESEDEERDEEEKAKEGEKKPKNKGFKNRVQKLRSRLAEKEREIEFLRQQSSRGQSQKEDQRPEPKQETKQTERPKSENYDSYEDYLDARDEWNRKQWDAENETKARETQVKDEYQKALNSHNERVAKFQKSNPEYNEVINEFLEEYGDQDGEFYFSPALNESILTSDLGPAILLELAKDPEELLRINALGYGAAQRAIGRIEARLENSSESSKTKTVEKKQTKAPPPLKPVGSSKATVKKSIYDANLSFKEYERLREEQLRKR